jgi:hypothetical protein
MTTPGLSSSRNRRAVVGIVLAAALTLTLVMLIVISGPSRVEVPNLGGKALGSAELRLTSLGLKSTVVHLSHGSGAVHEGIVLAQAPTPGSSVSGGSAIQLVVYGTWLAAGPTVKVPDLIGMLEWRAVNAIADRGLKPVEVLPKHLGSDSQFWKVESQSPTPGAALLVGVGHVVVRMRAPVIAVTSQIPTSACQSSGGPGIRVVEAFMISSAQLKQPPISDAGPLSRQAPDSLWKMCYVTGAHVYEQFGPPGTPSWGPPKAIYVYYRNGSLAEATASNYFQFKVSRR